jgi:hypothetical protein
MLFIYPIGGPRVSLGEMLQRGKQNLVSFRNISEDCIDRMCSSVEMIAKANSDERSDKGMCLKDVKHKRLSIGLEDFSEDNCWEWDPVFKILLSTICWPPIPAKK